MPNKNVIQSYLNNFRRHIYPYLKPSVGINAIVYPCEEEGAIISFCLGQNRSSCDDYKKKNKTITNVLKSNNLSHFFEEKIPDKKIETLKFKGTNYIMEGHHIILIKDDSPAQWNDKKSKDDVKKVLSEAFSWQMKIGNIEGSPTEIKDFCKNNNLDIKDLIEKPKKEINKLWIIIPSLLFLSFSFAILYFCPSSTNTLLKIILIVLGISFGGCAAFVIQLKYSNTAATIVFFIVCFFILGICTKFIPLKESFDTINAITIDKYKEMTPLPKNP